MRDVFMSYSSNNRRFIEKLVADLKEHSISVWLDQIDLTVGDPIHETIEQGIQQSRYFCIALSPSALSSYYVRKVEFELAFDRLVREERDSFILPIVAEPLNEPNDSLPPRLAGRFYLDFTNRKHYNENMRKLVKKIQLKDTRYTGKRWYKSLDISIFGEPVGVGELTQKASNGSCVCITWDQGIAKRVDVYSNGTQVNYKQFVFDKRGRVIENMMYSPDGHGGWHLVEDIWYYAYDPKTGRRTKKTMKAPGAHSWREATYNAFGKATEDKIVTDDGKPDLSLEYARKVFEYSPEGHSTRETWYDWEGRIIKDTANP